MVSIHPGHSVSDSFHIHHMNNIFRLTLATSLFCALTTPLPAKQESASPQKDHSSFLRSDYYVWNRFEKQGGPNAEQIKNIEVLIFFSPLVPDAKGKLTVDRKFEEALAKLKKAKSPKSQIWLGLGDLRAVSKNKQATDTLAKETVNLCKKYGFTGVDIDWEGNDDIPANVYADVLKSLSAACRKAKLAIANSVGTGPHYIAKSAAVQPYLDHINIQFYYSTRNAMSVNETKQVLDRFEKAGVPRRKLMIGLPVYGMVDMQKNRNAKPTALGYNFMISKGAKPNENTWVNPENGATYYYSGQPLIRSKVDFAKKNGYGGVFTWELTMDAPYSSPQSILRVLDEACKR